jgi:hypothetical protein
MPDSIRKLVYEQMWTILNTDTTFTYIKTKQRGYVPKSPDLLSSTMFPWAFIEFDYISDISGFRMPLNFKMDYSLSLVVMSHADKMGVTGMVVPCADCYPNLVRLLWTRGSSPIWSTTGGKCSVSQGTR